VRKQARGAQRSAAWRKEEGGSARGGRLSSVSMRQRRRHLREELEERLERRGLDELLLEFRAIKGGERAQRAVERHVLRRGDVGEDGVVLRGHLEELASGELVLFVLEVREAGGDTELRDQLCIVVGGALRLGDVVGHVREVAHLQRRADDVGAHLDDVLRRGAVVARAHIALERRVEVAALVVEGAKVVVPHANALLHQRSLVRVQVMLQLLELLRRLALDGLDPCVVAHEPAVVAGEGDELHEECGIVRPLHLELRHPQRILPMRRGGRGDEGEAADARDARVGGDVRLEVEQR
jgi:hypothetical protein